MSRNWKSLPRTGHSRQENVLTQPQNRKSLFANPDVVMEGWYPLAPSKKMKSGSAQSFVVLRQRIAVWRGHDEKLRALDAFCPHMGADLGNGDVIGNELRCYFHHWKFSESGKASSPGCSSKKGIKAQVRSYPVADFLGFVWVYAGETARTKLMPPHGLEGRELHAVKIAEATLFSHHHVMMAGGIDLLHFKTLHGIDVDFDFEHLNAGDGVLEWKMSGPIHPTNWRGRIGRCLVGPRFTYRMRVVSGTTVSLTYGENQRFMGRFFRLPSLHVLWGCSPLATGVSKVSVFSVVKKQRGLLAPIKTVLLHALTLALLLWLRDDDAKAFPNMRFQVSNPLPEDKPVLQLIFGINQMSESVWTKKNDEVFELSALNIGL